MENERVKKLTLDLDELAVESFDAAPSLHDQRGTVEGQTGGDETCYTCSCLGSCDGDASCYGYTWCTCGETCYTCSCFGSCDGDASCYGYTWCTCDETGDTCP
jgi:hypothetical protein